MKKAKPAGKKMKMSKGVKMSGGMVGNMSPYATNMEPKAKKAKKK